jgi:hypothetical protein
MIVLGLLTSVFYCSHLTLAEAENTIKCIDNECDKIQNFLIQCRTVEEYVDKMSLSLYDLSSAGILSTLAPLQIEIQNNLNIIANIVLLAKSLPEHLLTEDIRKRVRSVEKWMKEYDNFSLTAPLEDLTVNSLGQKFHDFKTALNGVVLVTYDDIKNEPIVSQLNEMNHWITKNESKLNLLKVKSEVLKETLTQENQQYNEAASKITSIIKLNFLKAMTRCTVELFKYLEETSKKGFHIRSIDSLRNILTVDWTPLESKLDDLTTKMSYFLSFSFHYFDINAMYTSLGNLKKIQTRLSELIILLVQQQNELKPNNHGVFLNDDRKFQRDLAVEFEVKAAKYLEPTKFNGYRYFLAVLVAGIVGYSVWMLLR